MTHQPERSPQNVFFDNFPSQLDQSTLLSMFERYATKGKILSFIVMPTTQNQYGMITYEHASDAKDCSRGLNGCHFAYWEDSHNFRTYILHITISGKGARSENPYGYSECFTPFWSNYGRGRSKESSSSEEIIEYSPTSSFRSQRSLGGHQLVEF